MIFGLDCPDGLNFPRMGDWHYDWVKLEGGSGPFH